MSKVILGLGSNLNNPIKQLQIAVDLLKEYFIVCKISHIYLSQSLLKDEQDDYYNVVLSAETDKQPLEVLSIAQNIENRMGRVKSKKWGARVIDIDIIDYDSCIIKEDNLEIPHNQMIYRSFVLKPLMDIVPEYTHPVLKLPLQILINSISDDYFIKVYEDKVILV